MNLPPIPAPVFSRAKALSQWIESRSAGDADHRGVVVASGKALFDAVRAQLVRLATPTGGGHQMLSSPPNDIWDLVKLLPPSDALAPKTEDALSKVPQHGDRSVLLGGGLAKQTNFDRDPTKPHLKRVDGAWFDFRFIVEDRAPGTPLAILAYSCEVRFPTAQGGPAWLRLDLNLPGHSNGDVGLRAHLHPATDEWSIPTPIVTPFEALDLLIWRTRNQERV